MRKIFLICMAVATLLILTVSASAATLNWENFVYTYDDSQVGCIIPAEQSTAVYFDLTTKVAEYTGAASQFLYHPGSHPRIQVWPFGGGNYMKLANIPVGTPMSWSVRYSTDGSAVTSALHGNFITYISYYDENFSGISTTIIDSGEQTLPHEIDVTITLDYPSNAKYFIVWSYLQGWDKYNSGVLITLECSPVAMLLGIEDYVAPGSGATAGLILGGLIGATQFNPEIADRFDDIRDPDKVLLDKWSHYTSSYVTYTQDATGIVRDRAGSFLAIKVFLELLFKIPFFEHILIISMTLGISGFILNLVSTASQKGGYHESTKPSSPKPSSPKRNG